MADPRDTGIYEIVNLENGKRYIGSAKCFAKRWSVHRANLRKGNHHSRYLQSAWNKYGGDAFEFRVLSICPLDSLVLSEQQALNRFRPEYNMSPTAGSTIGVEFSSERRAKISAALVGRKRDPAAVEASAAKLRGRKISDAARERRMGNKYAAGTLHSDERKAAAAAWLREQYETGARSRERSPEYREKIAASLRGRKLSPEHKAAVSAAMRGKKRGPYKKKIAPE